MNSLRSRTRRGRTSITDAARRYVEMVGRNDPYGAGFSPLG
jgi:hypothetical protein